MSKAVLCFAAAGVLTAGVLRARSAGPPAPGGTPGAEVVGLRVTKPLGEAKFSRMAVDRPTGTGLAVKVRRADRYLLGIDDAASSLGVFRDDKGTNLIVRGAPESPPDWIGYPVRVSDDGHECVFEIVSERTPAPGARSLHAEADVVLKFGRGEQTVMQRGLALKPGGRLTAGPVPMTIKSVQEDGWGDVRMIVTFTSLRSGEPIKHLAFLGPEGKAIDYQIVSQGRIGFAGLETYETSYGLHRKVARVTVRMTYFTSVGKLTVPVKLKAGVGF